MYVCMYNIYIYVYNMNMCVIHMYIYILSDRFGPQLKKHLVPWTSKDRFFFGNLLVLQHQRQDREVDGETTTPLTLLKRLNAYRKQCESNGEYVEAQKARKKYEELRAKDGCIAIFL